MTTEQAPNPEYERFKHFVIRSTQVATARIAAEDPYAQLNEESRLRALNTLDYAQKVPEAWPQMYELLMVLVPKMEMSGHRDAWVLYLEKAIVCSQRQRDQLSEGELSLHAGYLYHLMNRYDKARNWLHQSRLCFHEINNESGEGRALNRLAMVALREEKLAEAADYVMKGLLRLDQSHTDIANSYYVLGAIAERQRSWKEAENHYRHSLSQWQKELDPRRIAWGYRNLGPALRRQGKYAEAITCYEKALEQFTNIYDPINRGATMMNLGNVYLHLNKYKEAVSLYTDAKHIFLSFGDKLELGRVHLNLGRVYTKLGNWQLAESSLAQSIQIWDQLENARALCNAMDSLGEIYLLQNKFKMALTIFVDARVRLKDVKDKATFEQYQAMIEAHIKEAHMGIAECSAMPMC